jgi:pilus assembly protein CpaF
MATVHANSAREALVKPCMLPLLAGENLSPRFVVPTAASVDIVVHTGRPGRGEPGARDRVGARMGRTDAIEPVFRRDGARLVVAGGVPPRPERFDAVGIDLGRVLARSSVWSAAEGES